MDYDEPVIEQPYDARIDLSFSRQYGDTHEHTAISVTGESADFLPEVLTAMKQLLVASGFTYVAELVALNDEKVIVSTSGE